MKIWTLFENEPMAKNRRSEEILRKIFPDNYKSVYREILKKAGKYRFRKEKKIFTQADAVLILYGDNFRAKGEKPLKTLLRFLLKYAGGIINYVHILPFFPYSSDDGFSIIDYRKVDKKLGDWRNIRSISVKFGLVLDFVLNHISSRSIWFKGYLNLAAKYSDYFIRLSGKEDISKVVRPRSHPLLTGFTKRNGEKVKIWTTFSKDQVDLNFKAPEVFVEMTDIFLFYLSRGAKIVRLDAVAYLWKECGTECIHLEKTHLYVKFLRALVEELGIDALILTETNVPHEENISYFGRGDEAHMVYQFSLPPLLAHAIIREDLSVFNEWLKGLPSSGGGKYFFNFTASHDGVGVRPLAGLVKDGEIEFMTKKTLERGGLVSYKRNPDGSESPYELNISYMNLLNPPYAPADEKADRFMVSQFIMLSLKGIPGIYVHSLIGSENYVKGVKRTGRNRTINREKLDYDKFEREISGRSALRGIVYGKYSRLLEARRKEKAFHPDGLQKVLNFGDKIFAILRIYKGRKILCLANISGRALNIKDSASRNLSNSPFGEDIISGRKIALKNLILGPLEILWIKPLGK